MIYYDPIDNLNDTSSEISSVSSYRTSRYNIFSILLYDHNLFIFILLLIALEPAVEVPVNNNVKCGI